MAPREVDLNELFAKELAGKLNRDPELRYEVTETRATLREWVAERVREQTESEDMSRVVKAFLKSRLTIAEVWEFF